MPAPPARHGFFFVGPVSGGRSACLSRGDRELESGQPAQQHLQHDLEFGAGQRLTDARMRTGAEGGCGLGVRDRPIVSARKAGGPGVLPLVCIPRTQAPHR